MTTVSDVTCRWPGVRSCRHVAEYLVRGRTSGGLRVQAKLPSERYAVSAAAGREVSGRGAWAYPAPAGRCIPVRLGPVRSVKLQHPCEAVRQIAQRHHLSVADTGFAVRARSFHQGGQVPPVARRHGHHVGDSLHPANIQQFRAAPARRA